MAVKQEAQMFLDTLAELGLPPFETIDVATQRAMFDTPMEGSPEPEPIHSSLDRTIPGPAGDIPVRIYKPSDATGLPVIVFYHGGGWVLGGLIGHDALCRALANRCSAAVVSVDYRRAPEDPYPASIDDCVAATKWVADNGAELAVDVSRLAVGGDSAGGNLAAAVALSARDGSGPAIAAQLLIYPATDLAQPETDSYLANGDGYLLTKGWMDWFIDMYVPDREQRTEVLASPMLAASHAGLPPAIVITAEFDPLRDDGQAYAKRLGGSGRRCGLRRLRRHHPRLRQLLTHHERRPDRRRPHGGIPGRSLVEPRYRYRCPRCRLGRIQAASRQPSLGLILTSSDSAALVSEHDRLRNLRRCPRLSR